MPPRTDKPHGRNRVGRRPRNAQNTENNNVFVENEVAAIESEGDYDASRQHQGRVSTNPDVVPPHDLAQHTAPLTPPKIKEQRQEKATGGQESASENPRRPRNQKTKSQPKAVRAPRNGLTQHVDFPASKPASNTTGIFSETPSKLYAGPTFHASPAASSLPLPKFFSKSVPNVDKTISLRSMLERESQETSSNSDESPSKIAATPDLDRQAREESPLDIFFRADREAKARNAHARPDVFSSEKHPSSSRNLTVPLESPLGPRTTRNHIRHHTDGSANGVFPFEMEKNSSQAPNYFQPSSHGRGSGNPGTPTTNRSTGPLHDRSVDLKRLLNFGDAQIAKSHSQNDATLATNPITPSPKPRTQNRSSARLSGNLPIFPDGLEGTTPEQRKAALLALTERQISMSTLPAPQRPSSSSLRQEIKMPESPVTSQYQQPPSTLTPSRRVERHGPQTRSQRAPATTGHISTVPTVHSGNTQSFFASPNKDRDPAMKSMEDDLRRILKLDVLTSDNVTGVKS